MGTKMRLDRSKKLWCAIMINARIMQIKAERMDFEVFFAIK
jgi:hypothetical protein